MLETIHRAIDDLDPRAEVMTVGEFIDLFVAREPDAFDMEDLTYNDGTHCAITPLLWMSRDAILLDRRVKEAGTPRQFQDEMHAAGPYEMEVYTCTTCWEASPVIDQHDVTYYGRERWEEDGCPGPYGTCQCPGREYVVSYALSEYDPTRDYDYGGVVTYDENSDIIAIGNDIYDEFPPETRAYKYQGGVE